MASITEKIDNVLARKVPGSVSGGMVLPNFKENIYVSRNSLDLKKISNVCDRLSLHNTFFVGFERVKKPNKAIQS